MDLTWIQELNSEPNKIFIRARSAKLHHDVLMLKNFRSATTAAPYAQAQISVKLQIHLSA